MKVTVVPAQVTTVEDRVAGNLSFSQLILFAVPVFGGSLLFAILPPFMGASLLKIILIGIFAAVCSIMAIRIKGKIVLLWLVVLIRYRARPRTYVANKNIAVYRADYPPVPDAPVATTDAVTEETTYAFSPLGDSEKAYLLSSLNDPMNRLAVELTKKGGLHVRISEAKD